MILGAHARIERGDLGVRTPGLVADSGSQLIIGEHAHCADVLAPSVTIKHGAGGGMIAANVLHDPVHTMAGQDGRFSRSDHAVPAAGLGRG